jgi:hypothetical protein
VKRRSSWRDIAATRNETGRRVRIVNRMASRRPFESSEWSRKLEEASGKRAVISGVMSTSVRTVEIVTAEL